MTVLLYPGAGSDSTHSSLVAIEQAVSPHPCIRADFPYRKEGRRAPDRAPKLMASIRDELAVIGDDEPLVMGGRSMGGRMCSMVAAGVDGEPPPPNLRGLVLISYPLHPPGKPDSLRVEHLTSIVVPTLVISGTNDPSVRPTRSADGRQRCRAEPRFGTCSSRAPATTSKAPTTPLRVR